MGDFPQARSVRHSTLRAIAPRRHLRHYLSAARRAREILLARKRHHRILAVVALTAMILGLAILPARGTLQRTQAMPEARMQLALAVPHLASVQDGPLAQPVWQPVTVQPGQSLADLFKRQGFSAGDLQRALDADNNQSGLAHIRPGLRFEFLRGANAELLAMRYERNDAQRVTLQFYGDRAAETVQPMALERRTHVAHGVITDSLFDAGIHAGMSHAMVLELAKVFGYDIDFAQDLRSGDSFAVIYDSVYRDGEYLHSGNIIAAEFINRGRRYTAFRYTQPDGNVAYYSEDGRPLRKSFLRTPVDFTRISSRFSVARLHPVLGRMRAHKGVDYAAPQGTPIYAAGDGLVQFKGWENGYGNFVVIRHNKDISTAYGHMSRFASTLHKGGRVHQGQVIGYVGMTGLATGPHLHYEFRVDGKQRDPLTVTLPKPMPLPRAQLAAFRRNISPMLAQIERAHSHDIRLASVR